MFQICHEPIYFTIFLSDWMELYIFLSPNPYFPPPLLLNSYSKVDVLDPKPLSSWAQKFDRHVTVGCIVVCMPWLARWPHGSSGNWMYFWRDEIPRKNGLEKKISRLFFSWSSCDEEANVLFFLAAADNKCVRVNLLFFASSISTIKCRCVSNNKKRCIKSSWYERCRLLFEYTVCFFEFSGLFNLRKR